MALSAIDLSELDYLNEVQIDKSDSNRFVYLTKLGKRKKLEKASFLTFDSETKDGLKGKLLYCWSLCYRNKIKAFKKVKVKDKYRHEKTIEVPISNEEKFKLVNGMDNLDELFVFLKEIKQKKHNTIIFIHNLGFDIRFITDYCSRKRIQIMPIISGSNTIAFMIPSLRVKFVDSYQFLFSSQDIAEKEWEIDSKLTKIDCKDIFKKEFEKWNEEERKRLIEHNKNDVMALWEIMNKFRHTMFEITNVDVLQCISLATLSMKAYRKTIEKPILNPFVFTEYKPDNKNKKGKSKPVVYNYDKDLDDFVRSSYFGGRCELFNQNWVENASYIDKVSMYPFVMKTKKFPVGFGIYEDSYEILMKCIRSSGKYADIEGFIKCNIVPNSKTSKYPILPEKRAKKTTFSFCFKDEKVFTLPELRKAYEMGYLIEPILGYLYFESEYIFKDFITEMFKVKSESKGGKRNCAKITMNASYGKFGQSFERVGGYYTYFTDKKKFEKAIKEVDDNSVQFWDDDSEIGWIIERKNTVSIKPFMNVSIASYVTAYARLELWEMLHYCELNNIEVYYCDSDSFVIENKYKSFITFSKDLGGWDIEKEFLKVKFLALKAYIFEYIDTKTNVKKLGLKLKGVDKDKIKEIVENSKSVEEIEVKIKEPIQLAETYMKFTEAHRSGLILNTKIRCKHYSYENLKRQFNPDGTSIAWSQNAIKKYPSLAT